MTDRILLRGVSAVGRHGVLAQEKAAGQPFVVDVDMAVDLARAGASDDLTHTVSYAEIGADIVRLVETGSLDLIETLAEQIAAAVLARPLVESVAVTVHKPQAPVGVPFTDVGVRVERVRDVPVVVAMGGNLADVRATLSSAVRAVEAMPGVRVTAVSPLYETDPVGGPGDQAPYLNAVLLARTSRSPWSLLHSLHQVEKWHGRTREIRWGARTLDLDLIQYGDPDDGTDFRDDDPELMLPHPRAAERAFVLTPWLSVDAGARLRLGTSDVADVADLLGRLDSHGIRQGPAWPDRGGLPC